MAFKRNRKIEDEKQRQDVGFGANATSKNARLVNKNGTFNVKKIGQSFIARINVYHNLITMSWRRFIFYVFLFYFTLNFIFGIIYYLIGTENLAGIDTNPNMSPFWQAYFFSAQTLTTLGYGHISPATYTTSLISSFEALIGLMGFAIMTGLLYGRFSRPIPRIIYAEKAIIAPYLDHKGLMIRIVNERNNQLINVSSHLILSRNENVDGEMKRKYYPLELERSHITYFATSWTLVHPITEESMLYNETLESLTNSNTEILISIEGKNDTLSDPFHTRRSYLYSEIEFDARYVSMAYEVDNYYALDLSKISDFVKIQK